MSYPELLSAEEKLADAKRRLGIPRRCRPVRVNAVRRPDGGGRHRGVRARGPWC
jgi:hypothetical protein